MSIVLKDGVVLPSLPSDVLAECPYVVIVYAGSYFAYFSTKPFAYGSAELLASIGVETDVPCIATFGNGVLYATSGNSDEWGVGDDDINPGDMIIPMLEAWEPVWSNHDIEVAESIDLASMTFTTTGEVYFKNCNVFILPDGTELPALPDGCFDGTPYGFILKIDVRDSVGTVAYYLFLSANSISFCPGELIDVGYNLVLSVSDTCASYGFSEKTADWVDGQGGVNGMWTVDQGGVPMSYIGDMGTAGLYEVLWSNCDILTVTGVDEETGMPIIGTEIARKSDVNYRITGGVMRDFANQARRLGASTASLKPAEIEAIFRAVTP